MQSELGCRRELCCIAYDLILLMYRAHVDRIKNMLLLAAVYFRAMQWYLHKAGGLKTVLECSV